MSYVGQDIGEMLEHFYSACNACIASAVKKPSMSSLRLRTIQQFNQQLNQQLD